MVEQRRADSDYSSNRQGGWTTTVRRTWGTRQDLSSILDGQTACSVAFLHIQRISNHHRGEQIPVSAGPFHANSVLYSVSDC